MESGGRLHQVGEKPKHIWIFIGVVVASGLLCALLIVWAAEMTVRQNARLADSQPTVASKTANPPKLTTQIIASGYDHIWDIAFLPSKEAIFSERKGVLHLLKDGSVTTLATFGDVAAQNEFGLLGLAVDPLFSTNHTIYACMTVQGLSIHVMRLALAADLSKVDSRTDIISDIPGGKDYVHGGCRVEFGPDGYLWVGTGDVATGDEAIRPKELGGKVLRVDRDGKPASGNLGGNFDPRIFSYGHRNVQGLAFFPSPAVHQGVLGVNVEHGPTVDDEVNLLKPGNFGWAPPHDGYDQSVPMTDKLRFPDAVEPIWKSGDPTQAPSGATFVRGTQWKAWDGALAVAMLKAEHLTFLQIDSQNKIVHEDKVFEQQFGRLRKATQGPDGALYLTTDNGNNADKIIRVTPQ